MAGVPPLAELLRALMAEAQLDREFGERFRVSFLERRREPSPSSPAARASAATCRPSRFGHRADIVRHHLVPHPGIRRPLDAALSTTLPGCSRMPGDPR